MYLNGKDDRHYIETSDLSAATWGTITFEPKEGRAVSERFKTGRERVEKLKYFGKQFKERGGVIYLTYLQPIFGKSQSERLDKIALDVPFKIPV